MEIIIYLLIFIIIYSVYYFNIVRKKEGLEKYKNSTEVKYLIGVYKLNKEKINYKNLSKVLSLVNSIIITLTVIIISEVIDGNLFKFLIGALILIVLQITFYHIIGKYIKKRGI